MNLNQGLSLQSKRFTVSVSKSVFIVLMLFHQPYYTKIFIANDKDIANHDGKIFKTEGRNKAAKY